MMSDRHFQGNGIRLRAPEPEDLEVMFRFENATDVWEMSNTTGPYSRFQLKQYIEQTQNDLFADRQLRLMIENGNRQVVGMVDVCSFDPLHNRAEVGIMVDKSCRRQGIGRNALALLLTVLAPGEQRKKLLFTIVPAGLLILLLAFLFPNSPPGHYILLQLSTVVDEMFGTSYAIRYGVDSTSLANSASYRDALLDIFTVDWLNPWLGQGSGYHFSWYISGGATIHSIDNFYVANYIRYGYPGLVAYGLLILQAVGEMVRCGIQKKDRTMLCLALAVCGYFLNLWWMDTLQTIKYAYLPIALFQVISREKWENMSDLQHKAVHRYIR